MNAFFVATDNGKYVPATAIHRIEAHAPRGCRSGHRLLDRDGSLLGITHVIGRTLWGWSPAMPGEWERLYAHIETYSVSVEPVIAFAVTRDNRAVALVPSDLKGTDNNLLALRHAGNPEVFANQNQTFADAEAWLAHYIEGQR